MNPKRWRWYTWLALVWYVVNCLIQFQQAPASWLLLAAYLPFYWFFLWLLHEVIRAFYLAFTGKMPPPITKQG